VQLPPVVLVHGVATSAERTWRRLGWIDLLTESGREVHAVDLLGHGAAPKPHDPAAYTDLEGWLAERLPPGRLDAIGFSLGARLLLGIAADRPGLFRRLVAAGVGQNLLIDRREQARQLAAVIRSPEPPAIPDLAHFHALAGSPEVDRLAVASLVEGFDARLEPRRLGTVTCPVLLVMGDRDDTGPPDPLAAALPNVEVRILRGVDHFSTPKAFGFLDAALDWVNSPDP
jgi:pimeloyl-ACP methyl ester carboxylesterase